jgi:CTP:molybdopterin cytidylyltransferase MocA
VQAEKGMCEPGIGAIILAAGLSSRMAGFKPLLKIGEKTLLAHVVELFVGVGIESIVTVIGHRKKEMIPAVEAAGSLYVINNTFHDGMFSSIQHGVKKLQGMCDAFFLLPVDIPLVLPATVKKLVGAFSNDRSVMVCYPQFKSRRGHPPLINCLLADQILSYPGNGGMRGFLSSFGDLAIEVQVEDPYIHLDADSPDDLRLLKDTYLQRQKSC